MKAIIPLIAYKGFVQVTQAQLYMNMTVSLLNSSIEDNKLEAMSYDQKLEMGFKMYMVYSVGLILGA